MATPRNSAICEGGNLDQQTVLLVSDDSRFARALTSRWQSERNPPSFTQMSGDLCRELCADDFDLAIVGAVCPDLLSSALEALDATRRPVVLVSESDPQGGIRQVPHVMLLRQREGWLDALVLLAMEALRRSEACSQIQELEQANAALERHA